MRTAPMKKLVLLFALLFASDFLLAQSPNPYVTLGGNLQGPNGLPAVNQILSFTPTQSFFVAGLGSSACNSYILEINGVGLACADTVNFNNTTPAAPANGLNIVWQTSKSGSTDSVSGAVVGDGNIAHFLNGQGGFTTPTGGGGISGLTAGTFPIATSSTAIGNSLLTAVTGPNGLNYSLGGGLSIQLDASHLSFNSNIVGSSNVLIANTTNPGGGNNAGGIQLEAASTSGSACAGSSALVGGSNGAAGSGQAEITATGACANGFGLIGGNVTLQGGNSGGGNGNGNIIIVPGNEGIIELEGPVTQTGSTSNTFNGPVVYGAALNQTATKTIAGTCAMSTSTSCTFTISVTYTTPLCILTVQGATPMAGACSVSGTTVTITAASSNSQTWGAMIVGNPN